MMFKVSSLLSFIFLSNVQRMQYLAVTSLVDGHDEHDRHAVHQYELNEYVQDDVDEHAQDGVDVYAQDGVDECVRCEDVHDHVRDQCDVHDVVDSEQPHSLPPK